MLIYLHQGRDKVRRLPVVCPLIVGLLFMGGCLEESTRKSVKLVDDAMGEALKQLEIFGGSRTVVMWAEEPAELSDEQLQALKDVSPTKAKADQQKIKELTSKEVAAFNAALDKLEQVLGNTPPEAANTSKSIALAQGLAAEMRAYRATWAIDKYKLAEKTVLASQEKVRGLALEIKALEAEQSQLAKQTLTEPMGQAQKAIDDFQKAQKVAQGQLQRIDGAIEHLEALLKDATRRRDDLNLQITKLTNQLSRLGAEQAVSVQKKVNTLEAKRFRVSVQIDKLKAGPFQLPPEQTVELTGRELTTIAGLEQLRHEREILQQRTEKIEQAIDAQTKHVNDLQAQAKINVQKGQTVAARIDALEKALEQAIGALSDDLDQSSKLAEEGEKHLARARKYGDQAQRSAKQYFNAVRTASQGLKPGTKDYFLDEAQAAAPIGLVFDDIIVEVMLTKADVLAQRMRQLQSLPGVLETAKKYLQQEDLSKYLEEAETKSQELADELKKSIEDSIQISEAMRKRAKSAELQLVYSAKLAAVCYRVSTLGTDQSAQYLDQAKQICQELLEKNPNPEDPLAGPVFQLKRILGI